MKRICLVTGIACLILVPVLALAASFASQGLVLVDLNGKKVPLDTLMARGPVVLNFWATWCGPCRLEMPQFQKIYQVLHPKGVQFGAISLDRKLSKDVLEQFLKKGGVTVPVYRDEDGTLARKFSILAIPTTVVLKRDGEVFYLTKGYRPGDEVLLRKKIEELVAGGEKQAPSQPAQK